MTANSRDQLLGLALEVLRSGGTVSLDSVARQAGLTKPGLMHHFRTKEALMLALVDHVIDCWERELADRLPGPLAEAPAHERIRAYFDLALSGTADEADLVMLADPRLRRQLTARWKERLGPWVELPADLPPGERARLTAVRLLADGAWFADATRTFALDDDERARVRALAREMLEDRA
ncbi:TetR/AcrR family transcriptional regulator [Saccharopolyspora taberi]|uniref:TetR/AcrR family transcriptional regulator n=1 Tax=Saccharopolyspora taberi TaxID=60895 RepID=A0ABN3VN83_9PSEU